MTVSTSDKEAVLVIRSTGRHGGTGARVVKRLQAAGRLVRALVRSDDDRARRLRESGVQTLLGDLGRRRRTSRNLGCCTSHVELLKTTDHMRLTSMQDRT